MVGVFFGLYCFRRRLSSSFEVMDGDNQGNLKGKGSTKIDVAEYENGSRFNG
jgi:hypothetical protein